MIHGTNIIKLFYYFSSVALLTFHCLKKAMLSNTGGNDRDNSSTGAVFVGDPKCADETEVSGGVSVLSEAPANCARLDENAAAAKVPTMAESIVTYLQS